MLAYLISRTETSSKGSPGKLHPNIGCRPKKGRKCLAPLGGCLQPACVAGRCSMGSAANSQLAVPLEHVPAAIPTRKLSGRECRAASQQIAPVHVPVRSQKRAAAGLHGAKSSISRAPAMVVEEEGEESKAGYDNVLHPGSSPFSAANSGSAYRLVRAVATPKRSIGQANVVNRLAAVFHGEMATRVQERVESIFREVVLHRGSYAVRCRISFKRGSPRRRKISLGSSEPLSRGISRHHNQWSRPRFQKDWPLGR